MLSVKSREVVISQYWIGFELAVPQSLTIGQQVIVWGVQERVEIAPYPVEVHLHVQFRAISDRGEVRCVGRY